jgi:hypothetical protein
LEQVVQWQGISTFFLNDRLGYGLPMARIYARWAGGSLDLISMEGYGCDVFLRLPNIGKVEELKI